LTIYRPIQAGGGWRIRLALYVDGKFIGKIKGGERVTLNLLDGKHQIRLAQEMDLATVVEVRGNQIFRQRMDSRAEEVLLVDPVAKEEFEKTVPLNYGSMKEDER
jgi:hypothetical protein